MQQKNNKKPIIIAIVVVFAIVVAIIAIILAQPKAADDGGTTDDSDLSADVTLDIDEEQYLADEYNELQKIYVSLDDIMKIIDLNNAVREVSKTAILTVTETNGIIKLESNTEYISFNVIDERATDFTYVDGDTYITTGANETYLYYDSGITVEFETKDAAIIDHLQKQ